MNEKINKPRGGGLTRGGVVCRVSCPVHLSILCPQEYDGVPYDVQPNALYDRATIDDMVYLGKTGDMEIPYGYSGPKISAVGEGWARK